MSDTPRTDAVVHPLVILTTGESKRLYALACELERELAAQAALRPGHTFTTNPPFDPQWVEFTECRRCTYAEGLKEALTFYAELGHVSPSDGTVCDMGVVAKAALEAPFQCCGASNPPCPNFASSCRNPRNYHCKRCGGAGHIEVYDQTRGPDGDKYDVDCPECGGTGAREWHSQLPSEVKP